MKTNRIFPNVKKQRIVPATPLKYLGTVLLFTLLLPYIVSALFGNIEKEEIEASELLSEGKILVVNTTTAGSEQIPLELYVADKLTRVISKEYEPEALKAQAVLLRTALVEQLWETAGTKRGTVRVADPDYGSREILPQFREAAVSTAGVYLTVQGVPIKPSYCAVSNGATRSAREVLRTDNYPYLEGKLCSRDFLADNFVSTVTVSRAEFAGIWEKATGTPVKEDFDINTDFVFEWDSAGYVTGASYQKSTLPGEELRILLGLASSSFQAEEQSRKLVFSVKGVGHGFGMSQFGANEMAKQESDYIEILEFFFHNTQMTKIE